MNSSWDDPEDWDMLTNVVTEKGTYKLTEHGFEPVEPKALPQADGAGE